MSQSGNRRSRHHSNENLSALRDLINNTAAQAAIKLGQAFAATTTGHLTPEHFGYDSKTGQDFFASPAV